MRRAASIAGLSLAAVLCACSADGGGAPGGDGGLCAFTVTEADAWVNRMPTIGASRRPQLIVSVKVEPADRIRALTAISEDGPVLKLAVADGTAPLMPGVLSWRMYEPETPYEAIEIACGGTVKTRITSIQSVY